MSANRLTRAFLIHPLRTTAAPTSLAQTRSFLSSTRALQQKDEEPEDRTTLHPWRREGTGSGYDHEVAEKKETSWGNNTTDPDGERASARRESNGSPLEVSGANRDVSKTHDERALKDPDVAKLKSGTRSSKKHGKVSPM